MFHTYNWCALPEDDPNKVETFWSCNIVIVSHIYNNTAHSVGIVHDYQSMHGHENLKKGNCLPIKLGRINEKVVWQKTSTR